MEQEVKMRLYQEDFWWYAYVKKWPDSKNMLLIVDGEEVTLDISLAPKKDY